MTPRFILLWPVLAGCLAVTGNPTRAADALPPELVALHERSISDGECQSLNNLLPFYKPIIAALSDTRTLYVLPCDAGVLNTPWRLYVVSTGNDPPGARALIFAQFDQDFGWIADTQQFSVAFDPATKILKGTLYFTPRGNCGSEGMWQWRDYGFAMMSYRFQGDCKSTGAYQDWPVIWTETAAKTPRPLVPVPPSFTQGSP